MKGVHGERCISMIFESCRLLIFNYFVRMHSKIPYHVKVKMDCI